VEVPQPTDQLLAEMHLLQIATKDVHLNLLQIHVIAKEEQ
jgi:hypothetical protein